MNRNYRLKSKQFPELWVNEEYFAKVNKNKFLDSQINK